MVPSYKFLGRTLCIMLRKDLSVLLSHPSYCRWYVILLTCWLLIAVVVLYLLDSMAGVTCAIIQIWMEISGHYCFHEFFVILGFEIQLIKVVRWKEVLGRFRCFNYVTRSGLDEYQAVLRGLFDLDFISCLCVRLVICGFSSD